MAVIMRKIILTGVVLSIWYQGAFAVGPKIPFAEANCDKLGPPMPDHYRYPVSEGMAEDFGSTQGRINPHGGTDFITPNNTPVYPVGDGTVVWVGKTEVTGEIGDSKISDTFGCWVAIRNASNVFTFYAHLDCDKIYVNSGDIVDRTTILAKSDSSGYYKGMPVRPHLHVEFWDNCPSKIGSACWKGWIGLPPLTKDGRARDLRCLFSYPQPKPPTPPELPPTQLLTVANFPHDPNAMLGPEGYVTPGQIMTYTVMFENEGAGTAFDVYITDIFDGSLDDSNIVVKDFYLVDWAANTETPVTLPYSYDPQSHKLTVLAGTFDSRKGGKFTVELRLKPDVPQGTVVKNFATVYFPTALEETRTNSIISAVPEPALTAYTGSTVAVYSSYAMISAVVTGSGRTLLGKTVNFYIADSSFTAVTGGAGEASVYPQVDIPPGNYQLTAAFPGDGYYYASSTRTVTLQVLKAETYIADFSTVTYSTTPVISVAMTNSKGVRILHQDIAPKPIYLEYQNGETWEPLGQAILSSGTASFRFPLARPVSSIYHLKAKFNGDVNYFSTESTATLVFVDVTPPTAELFINGARLEDGATAYILNTDTITITAEDSGTGLKDILYTLDLQFSTNTATVYRTPFSLSAGTHTISYTAVDNAENMAGLRSVSFTVSGSTSAPDLNAVRLDLEPDILNLGSKGRYITADLKVEGENCINSRGIRISAVNGQELSDQIYALKSQDDGEEGQGYGNKDSGKCRKHDGGNESGKECYDGPSRHNGGDCSLCGHISVKFDREAVIAVLPVNVVSTITVSGTLTDGRGFNAVDTIKTMQPAADPVFRLGEVSVYHNPVKVAQAPVFHVETGIADSVKIKIFTVSGMVVHEYTMTGMPKIVEKDGTLVYVYEYAWEGHKNAGMYYYAAETAKDGRKLRKGGMFAVIR
jgi:hypothetical protein